MNTVFVENGLAIEIHYFNDNPKQMMIYLPDHQKTYFVSPEDYDRQLRIMSCKWIDEVEMAIHKFLNQKEAENA